LLRLTGVFIQRFRAEEAERLFQKIQISGILGRCLSGMDILGKAEICAAAGRKK
jgi:hypothetical protein